MQKWFAHRSNKYFFYEISHFSICRCICACVGILAIRSLTANNMYHRSLYHKHNWDVTSKIHATFIIFWHSVYWWNCTQGGANSRFISPTHKESSKWRRTIPHPKTLLFLWCNTTSNITIIRIYLCYTNYLSIMFPVFYETTLKTLI